MTPLDYLLCFAAFTIAHGIDIFWIQIPKYRRLWAKSNECFSFKKFWDADWNLFIGTFLFCLVMLLAADKIPELTRHKIDYTYMPLLFAGLGGFGSTIAMNKWSRTGKFIENIIDKKTDIADNKTGV